VRIQLEWPETEARLHVGARMSDSEDAAMSAEEMHELRTAYVGEGLFGISRCFRKLLQERNELRTSLREVYQAMVRYEMDVDEDPPCEHREMMARAKAVLEMDLSGFKDFEGDVYVP